MDSTMFFETLLKYFNLHYVTLISAICILLLPKSKFFDSDKKDIFMRLVAVGALVLSFCEVFELAYGTYFTEPKSMRYILSTICYLVRPLLIIFMGLILRPDIFRRWYAYIPLEISIVFLLINFPTHIVFFYNENNSFIRGPLGFLPLIVSLIYVILFVVFLVLKCKKDGFKDSIILFFFCIAIVGFSVLELLTTNKYIAGITCFGALIYYLYLYFVYIKRDALTGVLNRYAYYSDTTKIANKISGLIVIDINGLKAMNDAQGHIAGDGLIISVAKSLHSSLHTSSSNVYRIGGDEFICVFYGNNEEEIINAFNKAKNDLLSHDLSCAMGYAINSNNKLLDKLYVEADRMMYEDKMKHYMAVEKN